MSHAGAVTVGQWYVRCERMFVTLTKRRGGLTMAGSKGKGGPNRRFVSPDREGGYRIEAPGAQRASAKLPTKAAAEKRAKEIVKNLGGGEVTFRGPDGRITDSDTVAPGR